MIFYFELEDRNGVITPIVNPQGWDSATFSIERDPVLHGVFFTYQTGDFTYYRKAAQLLQEEYDTYKSEGVMYLHIKYDCGDGVISELETGKVNFDQWRDIKGTTCNVKIPVTIQGDLTVFRNRFDQKVNLDTATAFDGATSLPAYDGLAKEITLPGKSIFAQNTAATTDDIVGQFMGAWHDSGSTGPGSSIGYVEYDYFIPAFQNNVAAEIGGFGVPAITSLSEYNFTMSNNALSIDQGWHLPYSPTTSGTFTAIDTVNLDQINPLVNYDPTIGNVYGTGPFPDLTLEIELINTSILNHFNVPTGDYVTEGLRNWCYYFCIRRAHSYNAVLNQFGDGVDWYSDITWSIAQDGIGSPVFPVGTTASFSQMLTGLTLYPGDRMYFFRVNAYQKKDLLSSEYAFEITEAAGSYIKLYGLSHIADTTTRVYLVNEALSRVTEAITDDNMRVYSEYFGRTDSQPYAAPADGCGSLEALTSGLHIRRMYETRPDTPPLLNLSMKDLKDGLNPIHAIGMGLEPDPNRPGYNLIRVESWDYFYSDEVVLYCYDVDKIETIFEPSEVVSSFTFGYDKWEAEDFNGIDEFLTKRIFRTSISQVVKSYEQITEFIASGFAWEVTRRKGNVTSEDWRYDKNTFILCLERVGDHLEVEQGNVTDPTNIVDPDTVYNWRIRPVHMGMRWAPQVFTTYAQMDANAVLIFTDGTGNYYASGSQTSTFCQLSAAIISEKDTISQDIYSNPSASYPKWYPESVSFNYPMKVEDYKALKANPNGLIYYDTKGKAGYGWIKKIDYNIKKGTASFKLRPKR